MLDASAKNPHRAATGGPPLDFQEHLRLLDERGLLTRIDRPIDKDRELHPLVRWQFQGGLAEDCIPLRAFSSSKHSASATIFRSRPPAERTS